MLAYQPGDSFDVFCPNRAADVDHMLHRLGLHSQRNHHVNISLQKDTKKKGNTTTGTLLKITHNVDNRISHCSDHHDCEAAPLSSSF